MKKRKILLGLAMATAVLSLASCNTSSSQVASSSASASQEATSTPAQATSTIVTPTATSSSTGMAQSSIESTETPATPSASSVTPVTPSTSSETPVTPSASSETPVTPSASSETPVTPSSSSETPATSFTVTYVTSQGEAPAALTNVTALPETLPTLTSELYNFGGWSTTENGTTAVAGGTAITADTTLYAIWTAKSEYQVISTNEGKLYNTDFTEETVNTFGDAAYTTPGIYAKSEQTEALKVTVADGKLTGTDADTANSADAIISFGTVYEGVVEGVMDYTPVNTDSKTNGKWSFIQFMGQLDGKKDTTLFALRTSDEKSNQRVLLYVNGAYVASTTAPTYTPSTSYEVYFKYDFATGKLTVKFGDAYICQDYTFEEALRPLALYGVRFVSAGNDTARGFKVDNFAVMETTKMELDAFKTYAKARLDRVYNAINLENYALSADYITSEYNNASKTINEASDNSQAFQALINADIYTLLDDAAYKAKLVNEYEDDQTATASLYTYNATNFENAYTTVIAAINAATTKEEIDTAIETFDTTFATIEDDDIVRENKLSEFETFFENLTSTLTDADADLYAELTSYYNEGVTAINSAAMTDIDELIATYKDGLQQIYDAGTMTLAEIVAKYNEDITSKKSEAATYVADTALVEQVNNIQLLNVEDYTTADAAYQAYQDTLTTIQNIKDYFDTVTEAYNEVVQYKVDLVATLLIDEDTYDSTYKANIDNLIDKDEFYTNVELDTYVASKKAEILSAINGIKAITEAVITYMTDKDTVFYEYSVLKDTQIVSITDTPTLDGAVFAGWDFDFTTTITDNTKIYAIWHDTYGNDAINVKAQNFAFTSSVDVKTSKTYGDFTVNPGSYGKFKEHKDGYIDLFAGNTVTFTVTNDNAVFMISYAGNNSSRYALLTSTNTEYTETKKNTTSFTDGGTEYSYGGLSITLDASAKGWLIFEGLKAGNYTLSFGSDDTADTKAEQKISAFKLLDGCTYAKEVTAISADAQFDSASKKITINNVTLTCKDESTLTITEGYNVKVTLDGLAIDYSNISQTGDYVVTVTYGDYTTVQYTLIIDDLGD